MNRSEMLARIRSWVACTPPHLRASAWTLIPSTSGLAHLDWIDSGERHREVVQVGTRAAFSPAIRTPTIRVETRYLVVLEYPHIVIFDAKAPIYVKRDGMATREWIQKRERGRFHLSAFRSTLTADALELTPFRPDDVFDVLMFFAPNPLMGWTMEESRHWGPEIHKWGPLANGARGSVCYLPTYLVRDALWTPQPKKIKHPSESDGVGWLLTDPQTREPVLFYPSLYHKNTHIRLSHAADEGIEQTKRLWSTIVLGEDACAGA